MIFTMNIFHLLWIIPVSMVAGFAMAAVVYLKKKSKKDQTNWSDWYYDEEWED